MPARTLGSNKWTSPASNVHDALRDSPADAALFRSRIPSRLGPSSCPGWVPSPSAGGLLMLLVKKRYPYQQITNSATKHPNAIPTITPFQFSPLSTLPV